MVVLFTSLSPSSNMFFTCWRPFSRCTIVMAMASLICQDTEEIASWCDEAFYQLRLMDLWAAPDFLSHLTSPLPAVMFCRAPTAASWVLWRTLQAIRERYMRTVMVLHSHSMPWGFGLSSSRGHCRCTFYRETVCELQLVFSHWV